MQTYPILLHAGSGPLLACLPDPDPDWLAETATALANGDGGTILFGTDSSGTARAVDSAYLTELLDAIALACRPPLEINPPAPLRTAEGDVLAVRVPRSPQVHALADGRVYVRAGSDNRLLDGQEIRRLIDYRSTGDFESETVPGARPSDLDPALLADFLVQRGVRLRQAWRQDADDLLIRAGAITPDYQVTVAGLLLFGRDPRRWLPHSGVQFERYIGTEPHPDALGLAQYVEGAIVPLLDQLWDLIAAQMPRRVFDGHSGRPDYPAEALREALINAVCHRDYRLRGDPISVRMFTDRIEITSPGGLPGFVTLAHLPHTRFSRNPLLAWGLYHWGYIDAPGTGIRRMVESLQANEQPGPEFDASDYHVTVRLYRARVSAPAPPLPPPPSGPLNDRQRRALEHVQRHGSITLHEYRALCRSYAPALLQSDLTEMVRQGRLRKVGARANTYYMLP